MALDIFIKKRTGQVQAGTLAPWLGRAGIGEEGDRNFFGNVGAGTHGFSLGTLDP